MANELTLIEVAEKHCLELKGRFPELPVLDSIGNQLAYLREFMTGGEIDRDRLNSIIIGVQTAREIEPLDMDAADSFYEVSEMVKSLPKA